MEEKEYTLEEVKTEAKAFLTVKESKNTNTFLSYKTSINYFLYYLEHIVQVKKIGTRNIGIILEGFQGSLMSGFTYESEDIKRNVKVKGSGTNSHLRRIRTFLNKCLKLTSDLEPIKIKKQIKYKALPVEEIQLLIDEAPNKWKKEEIALRNSCLIRFLFNTAFRVSEALSLTVDNLVNDNGFYYVRVHEKGTEKGSLSDPIAISESDYNHLQNYIKIKSTPSDYVFSTKSGKALSRQYFNKDVKALARYVDAEHGTNISEIVENNSSHVFRHSKGHALLNEDDVNIMKVKKYLRHSSISSTQIYLEANDKEVDKLRSNNILK